MRKMKFVVIDNTSFPQIGLLTFILDTECSKHSADLTPSYFSDEDPSTVSLPSCSRLIHATQVQQTFQRLGVLRLLCSSPVIYFIFSDYESKNQQLISTYLTRYACLFDCDCFLL